MDIARLINELNSAHGLIERLSERTIQGALENSNSLIEFLKNKEYTRNVYLGDDFIPDTNLYNLLGAIYPRLNVDKKENVLRLF